MKKTLDKLKEALRTGKDIALNGRKISQVNYKTMTFNGDIAIRFEKETEFILCKIWEIEIKPSKL